MVRASRNVCNRGFHSYAEKAQGFGGSIKSHLTSDCHLPIGFCNLCLRPAIDPIVSPSGHIYEREVILEYILTKAQELKKQNLNINNTINDDLILMNYNDDKEAEEVKKLKQTQEFMTKVDCIPDKKILKLNEKSYQTQERSKLIDDTNNEMKQELLKHANPFMPQFQPSSSTDTTKIKSKQRPNSPISGNPIRSKDLIKVNIERDANTSDRIICSVSKKIITSQKVVVIKSTGVLMLKSVYLDLKLNDSLTCPITNRKFKLRDVVELKRAGSGFAGSGTQVEVKVWRPGIN